MRLKFVQNLIDYFRNKILYVPIFLRRENEIKNNQNFETLILGSSHIIPYVCNEAELNVSLPSQDLYYSYNMYKKLTHSGLKNIIISFSVFTPGLCLIKTGEPQFLLCILYKLFFGIDYEYKEIAESKHLYDKEFHLLKVINKYRKKLNFKSRSKKKMDAYSTKAKEYKNVKSRALKHLKNNSRLIDEMDWLKKLLDESEQNNQNVFIVIPSFLKSYRSFLPESDILFEKLFRIAANYSHAKILNYYDSDIFKDIDYSDSDHLSDNAWSKFSIILKNEIY